MNEVTVTLKGEDSSFRKKYLVYEEFKMVYDDPIIVSLIDKTKKEFNGVVEGIKVRALLVVE